jgi:two-component system, OmpR family, sensor kinase
MRLPLRVRLTLAFALGMALVLSGLGAFVYLRVGRDLLASTDLGLRSRAQVLVDSVGRRGAALPGASGGLIDPDESFAQVLDPSGAVMDSSSEATKAPLLSPTSLRSVAGATFFVRSEPRIDTDPVRLLAVPAGSAGDRVFVVVGATLGDRRDALHRLLVSLAVGGPVALILTSAAGWAMAGAALRPVERMRREADAISVSEPDRRLPVPSTGDELARLGTTLNTMLDRLQASFERERRFVDDASHELRTPLSVLKMELDLSMARNRTPEELKAALASASEETDRLVRLAEDLLVLARSERGRLPLHREELDLSELLSRTCAAYEARARANGVRIDLTATSEKANVDPARVRQALENLLDNALRHTPSGGVVEVRAGREGRVVSVVVKDSGPGFAADMLHRAFEPFARSEADEAGNGSTAGLGLAIVRSIAEAHGGAVVAENPPEGGARLTVSLRV